MRKTKKSSNSSTSDSECCQHANADSPKQLDDGFFEIETIRRKRLRKGEVQYLIKWRGWPETANTWEPLHNLQSVPDLIHAFEESLKSAATAGGGAKPLRKRTRRTTTTQLPPQTTNARPTPLPNSQQHTAHQNQPTPNTHNNLPQQQSPIHAQSNGNSLHRRGTNRRKSRSVKRFKKEESASQSAPTNNALGSPTAYVGNNINTHQIITDAKTASNIVKIIKAIGYSTSLSCYKQDILVTFMAMRSDGTEVMVDNKYLKANNPLLLINFYEQHLRYNPT